MAIAQNGIIGKNNGLPWRIPEDLKRFKEITIGNAVLTGKRTYESIIRMIGKPLPERRNIVLIQNDEKLEMEPHRIVNSIEDALNIRDEKEIFIAGGASIYRQFLPYADELLVTEVKKDYEGDTCFPEYDKADWEEVSREDCETKGDSPNISFVRYRRKTANQDFVTIQNAGDKRKEYEETLKKISGCKHCPFCRENLPANKILISCEFSDTDLVKLKSS